MFIGWQLGRDLFLVCFELVDVTLDVWVPYGGGILQYVTDERVLLMYVSHSIHFYMTLPFHMKQASERMPFLQLPQTTYSEITIHIPILATEEVM